MNAKNTADVGVLVGRFQAHVLHDGHKALLDYVSSKHQQVIVFLGVTASVKLTRRNPLDFASRKRMIEDAYPEIIVLPLADKKTDEEWSLILDSKIAETCDGRSVLLYGSRDSFIPYYKGKYPAEELEDSVTMSATKVRESVSSTVRNSDDFRHGVVYSAYSRHPTSYQTVDVILWDDSPDKGFLVGKKNSDNGRVRFIGGFVDPVKDNSLEEAAAREALEEATVTAHQLRYIGSYRVDDWRYRSESDKIMTAVFFSNNFSGEPQAGDDIDEVLWIPTFGELIEQLTDEHKPLAQFAIDLL